LGGASGGILSKDTTNVQVYNNTIWNSQWAVESQAPQDLRVYNNLTQNSVGGTDLQNNLITDGSDFVGPNSGNFQLQSGSGAIDGGRTVSGITDGYAGSAPDIGAFESGVTPWTAGAKTSGTTALPAPRNLRISIK
jgi:hypothetical protein